MECKDCAIINGHNDACWKSQVHDLYQALDQILENNDILTRSKATNVMNKIRTINNYWS